MLFSPVLTAAFYGCSFDLSIKLFLNCPQAPSISAPISLLIVTLIPYFSSLFLKFSTTFFVDFIYPFGYGLSYSDFAYEKIESVKQDKKNIRVTVSVKNTSGRDGEEVVQLYASYPDSKVERPSKQLRAFKRIPIKAGESREVTLTVPKEELGYWNEEKQMFVVEPGTVKLLIGASSEDIRLEGKVKL